MLVIKNGNVWKGRLTWRCRQNSTGRLLCHPLPCPEESSMFEVSKRRGPIREGQLSSTFGFFCYIEWRLDLHSRITWLWLGSNNIRIDVANAYRNIKGIFNSQTLQFFLPSKRAPSAYKRSTRRKSVCFRFLITFRFSFSKTWNSRGQRTPRRRRPRGPDRQEPKPSNIGSGLA